MIWGTGDGDDHTPPVTAVPEGCSACKIISPSNLYHDEELLIGYQSY